MFDDYAHAIVSVAAFALMVLVLAGLSGYRKGVAKLPAGGSPKEDYADPLYRTHRAYLNASEALAVFAAVVAAAVLAGASPFLVNLIATIVVLVRIATAVVHIRGIGAENGGPRSILFGVAWIGMIALAVLAILAGLSGPGGA
ncbi:MAG: MAPEG family protein [Pseudomonadota bacterium]